MKSFNPDKLFEHYCINNNCFGVYIAGEQFDFEEDTRWQHFIGLVQETFPEQKQWANILGAVVNSEYIVMDSQEDAKKLMKIMGDSYFYGNEYAAMFGPNGWITENT